ncbi:MAG: hypothetical protein O7G85_09870, partial [Planctomycetota bacterium]|nr:hypothetical protein [Planctomycetota bacterium]
MSEKFKYCCAAVLTGSLLSMTQQSHGQVCNSVDLVFVMDTSQSMSGLSNDACDIMGWIANRLALDFDVEVTKLGIINESLFCPSCITCIGDLEQFNVLNMLGSPNSASPPKYHARVPQSDPPRYLEEAPNHNESWGEAVSIIADRFPWRENAVRLIIPVADEGPFLGDASIDCETVFPVPVDRVSINDAINAAFNANLQYNVIVAPVIMLGQMMSESHDCIVMLANDLSMATSVNSDNRTNGNAFDAHTFQNPNLQIETNDFADRVKDDIFETFGGLCACTTTGPDVDGNGIPDGCQDCNNNTLFDPDEINLYGIGEDCDGNGVPDACQIA